MQGRFCIKERKKELKLYIYIYIVERERGESFWKRKTGIRKERKELKFDR